VDYAIPMVFPDYLIMVAQVKKREIDLIPYVDFDNVRIRDAKVKVPELGHASVMIINGATGLTRYYEYGRYDKQNLGLVRTVKVPDVKVTGGKPDWKTLKAPLARVSKVAGQGGRIEAVLIEVDGKFPAMQKYATGRMKDNSNPKRAPYHLLRNSCVHFARDVVDAAGADTPWMLDPRPNSYIGEFQDKYADVKYQPRGAKLEIEGIGSF
jgi:hypothetical protein